MKTPTIAIVLAVLAIPAFADKGYHWPKAGSLSHGGSPGLAGFAGSSPEPGGLDSGRHANHGSPGNFYGGHTGSSQHMLTGLPSEGGTHFPGAHSHGTRTPGDHDVWHFQPFKPLKTVSAPPQRPTVYRSTGFHFTQTSIKPLKLTGARGGSGGGGGGGGFGSFDEFSNSHAPHVRDDIITRNHGPRGPRPPATGKSSSTQSPSD